MSTWLLHQLFRSYTGGVKSFNFNCFRYYNSVNAAEITKDFYIIPKDNRKHHNERFLHRKNTADYAKKKKKPITSNAFGNYLLAITNDFYRCYTCLTVVTKRFCIRKRCPELAKGWKTFEYRWFRAFCFRYDEEILQH